jgi:hypothetical protein
MIATGALRDYLNASLIPLHARNAAELFPYFPSQMMKPAI